MSENLVQQQLYTRERGGIFHSTDGYDTIAISDGLDKNYVKKYLHPICIYHAPKSLIERGEKDAALYPQALTLIQPGETGDLIIGQAVFVPADFTGQRSTYFMHNYIIPKERKEEWIRQPEMLFQLKDFKTSYDIGMGQVLPEGNALPYDETAILNVKGELLAKLGITEAMFKQLLFAVMSSVSGKKKVFISLNVPLQDYPNDAKKLLELLFFYLPYAYRRNLGALTFTSEPEAKKYIHVMFFEPGTLNYGDRSMEKQFIFDFSKGRISGVDLEGQQHEYLDYALEHFSESKQIDAFFEFAERALSGLDALELASYYELTAIYRTLTEADALFYPNNKTGFLHSLLKFLQVSGDDKEELIHLFVDLLDAESYASDSETAIDYLKAVLEFNRFALCGESVTFILKTIDFYKSDSLFQELWKLLEQDKRTYQALLAFINKYPEYGDLTQLYLNQRFKQVTQVEEFLTELKNMLQSPYLLKNENFIAVVTEKVAAAVKYSGDPFKAALAVKEFTIENHDREFAPFKEHLNDQAKKALLNTLELRFLTLENIKASAAIFTWKINEKQLNLLTGAEKEKYTMLMTLYELIDSPPPSSALHFNSLTIVNRGMVRTILKQILGKNIHPNNFRLILIAFEDDQGSHYFGELFKYLAANSDDKTMLAFIKWAESNIKSKSYYHEALRKYLLRNSRSIWKNKANRTELKKIDSKGLNRVLKVVQTDTAHPAVKFLKKRGLFLSLALVVLAGAGWAGYNLLFGNDKPNDAITVSKTGREAEKDKGIEAETASIIPLVSFVERKAGGGTDKSFFINLNGEKAAKIDVPNGLANSFILTESGKAALPLNLAIEFEPSPFDPNGGLRAGFSCYGVEHDFNQDGNPEVVVVAGDKKTASYVWVFATSGHHTGKEPLNPIFTIQGHADVKLQADKLILPNESGPAEEYIFKEGTFVKK